ncbi:MAG: hypothetical protein ACRDIU_02285 [Actinomycetota bacterium]
MNLILDTGALIALERNDREMWRRLELARGRGDDAPTHGGVVGQAWRGDGPREALLAKALKGVDIKSLDEELGRAAGVLLGRARGSDVIDAALVLLAADGDRIATSDVEDLRPLAEESGVHIDLIAV